MKSASGHFYPVLSDAQLDEWVTLALRQKSSVLIGYEWAERTRPLLNAVIRMVADVQDTRAALAAEQARVARLETLLAKGQRDRHGDFHPLVPFEECERGDCCDVLAALAPADGEG